MMRKKGKLGARCALGLIAVASVLAGCGSTSSGDPAVSVSTIDFESPGIRGDGFLRPSVHCGWGALWLPLKWGRVPPGTTELALFISRFKYVHTGGHTKPVVTYADLVYRIDSSLHRNPANELPENAQWSNVGRRSCPQPWGDQKIAQAIFALHRVHARHLSWEEATRLTEGALAAERTSRPISMPSGSLAEDAVGVGSFVTGYAPGSGPAE